MKQSTSGNGIYYFLGNITSHILHALPLYKELGGTFVVLSNKAKCEIEQRYDVTVININDKPYKWQRFGWRIKPIRHYLDIDGDLKKTTAYLNQNAKVVLFYELYNFAPSVRLTKPKTVFLTHGYMIKDYMGQNNRVKILDQYDYMAAIGPSLKRQFIERDGIDPGKLVDIGIARTDDIVKHRGQIIPPKGLVEAGVIDPAKPIISYLPTFWGASSIYDTGLELVRNWPDEYTLVFRPHPQTPKKLLRKYLHLINSRPSIIYAPEGKYTELGLVDIFNASSAIIGDVSSVMAEAILSDKPLLLVDVSTNTKSQPKLGNHLESLFGNYTKIRYSNQLAEAIRLALCQEIDRNKDQVKREYFYQYNGNAIAAIKDYINRLL